MKHIKSLREVKDLEIGFNDTIVRNCDSVNINTLIDKLTEFREKLCGPEVGGDTICKFMMESIMYDEDLDY